MKQPKVLVVAPQAKIAFQGELGAFSQRACRQIFGAKIAPFPCISFEDVFEAIAKKKATAGVIPIENTLAGSIHQNFDLLARYPFEAVAETFVRIEHSLIAHSGISLEKITQIFSHPVALAQCQKILRRLKRVEKVSFYDTAGSVQYIRDNELHHAAAIASSDAARLYGMKILRRGIEDNRENYTRFLALAPKGHLSSQGRKTTVIFGLKNEPGALFKSLSVFALRNIDLTKIESRPIHGKPWEYLFYLDLQSDVHSRECSNALRHLREMTLYFKILGCYPTY